MDLTKRCSKEKRHRSPWAPPWTRSGPPKALEGAKALWRQCYHHCSQHPAVRLQDSQGGGGMGQQRGDGDAPQRSGSTGPAASSTQSPWQHHRSHLQVTQLQPRSSRQRAARSCCTLLPADSQPQLAAGSAPGHTKGCGSKLWEADPTQAQAGTQRGHCCPRCAPGGKAASC